MPETSTQPAITDIVDGRFQLVPEEAFLSTTLKGNLENNFLPFFVELSKLSKMAGVELSPKAAREARIAVKNVRCAAEKKREELKQESLRSGRAIDGVNKLLLSFAAPLEKSFEDMELAEARKIAAIREQWTKERLEQITPYLDPALPVPNVTDVTDDQFKVMLDDAKANYDRRIERARQEEADRLAKEKAEEEERERIRLENEQLKQQAAKLAAERAESEKALAAEKQKAAQEAAAREAQAAADRRAQELQRQQENAAAQARLDAEREARQAAEKAAADAIEKAKQELAKKNAEEELARQRRIAEENKAKAAAPDRQKILACATEFALVPLPKVEGKEAQAIVAQIKASQDKFVDWITTKAKALSPQEPPKGSALSEL